jgi:integrase
MRLAEIQPRDVQQLVDRLVEDHCSAASIDAAIAPLRALYRRAVARGEAPHNPTLRIEKPAVRCKVRIVATPAQAGRMLAALDPADRPLWAIAFYAGLRRGELVALPWDDVDLATGVMHVRRGWDAVEGEIAPKSRQGAVTCRSRPSCATTWSSTGWRAWRMAGCSTASARSARRLSGPQGYGSPLGSPV